MWLEMYFDVSQTGEKKKTLFHKHNLLTILRYVSPSVAARYTFVQKQTTHLIYTR